MQVRRARRIGHGRAARDDRVGGLREEERRLALVAAHLAHVRGIVAADAVDAMHGKTLGAGGDLDGGLKRRRKHEAHDCSLRR
jgi:hypothetical protein